MAIWLNLISYSWYRKWFAKNNFLAYYPLAQGWVTAFWSSRWPSWWPGRVRGRGRGVAAPPACSWNAPSPATFRVRTVSPWSAQSRENSGQNKNSVVPIRIRLPFWCRSGWGSDPDPSPSSSFYFYLQQCQFTLSYLSHQCHRCHNFLYFGQHIEIFEEKAYFIFTFGWNGHRSGSGSAGPCMPFPIRIR